MLILMIWLEYISVCKNKCFLQLSYVLSIVLSVLILHQSVLGCLIYALWMAY